LFALAALDALYVERDGQYPITPLKRDPKDFSTREMKREIARCRSLEALYRTAQTLLPELDISNDSIAYYATLVDFYTVQKLQQLSAGMARLYLLCFLLQRYRKINDNLIDALIYHVRKIGTAAKACMQERVVGDFIVRMSRGDGPAKSNGTSVYPAVANEDLPASPDADGHYASDQAPATADLQVNGLRVGHNVLIAQLFQIEPNHSSPTVFSGTRVRLDPSVSLVPVEAVVLFETKDGGGRLNNGMEQQRLPQQLALWDHLPAVETINITDGQYGELTSVTHKMQRYRRDANGVFSVGTQASPDTVWQTCGVQFRLVNYFELQVPLRNVFPVRGNGDENSHWPIGTNDDAPVQDNASRVKRDPRHMDGTVTAIFMGRAAFSDAKEVMRALPSQGVIGVSLIETRSSDGAIAHELGHLSGLRDADGTEKDSAGTLLYDVMIQTGPGTTPTATECLLMSKWAPSYKKFFANQPKQ
jgi:hypothetical protein